MSDRLTVAACASVAAAAALVFLWRRGRTAPQLIEYDEFALFHENCAEHGLPYDGPPKVSRIQVVLPDGRTLSALKWGASDPKMVLLHGGAQNAHTWDTVALALGLPLLAIDLPGHGHSDGPPLGHALDPTNAAADVAHVIDKFAPTATLLVGMSFGGMVAVALSSLRPELVRRLVLVDVTPGVTQKKASAILKFVDGPATFDSFEAILARTMEYNPTRSEASLRRGILHNAHQLTDGSWVWRHARHRDIAAEKRLDRQRQHDPAAFTPLWEHLSHLKAPLCLARGMRSSSVVDDADVEELRKRAPHARVVPFAQSGHSVQGDEPLALASLLDELLAPRVRVGVLNPNDGNAYNAAAMSMLRELLERVGARIDLEELNVCSLRLTELLPKLGGYDGFIVPGSPESVAAGSYVRSEPPGWISPLERLLRQLDAKRRPLLGICFGHQILATALGGRVEKSTHGLQAGECSFTLTALGRTLFSGSGTTTSTGDESLGAAAQVAMQYHHSDVVSRLPTSAANCGCSATNPAHVAAYFPSAVVARTAVTRGCLGGDKEKPHAFSFQAHPEFCTGTGSAVLEALVRKDGEERGEAWTSERVATVGSAASAEASARLTATCVRMLWPNAIDTLPGARSRSDACRA